MDRTSFAAPVETLKKRAEGADDFHGKHYHIDEQDTEKHHHGVFLHLLRTLGGFFFQVVLFYLAHIKDQHLKIHLLVIAPQGSDESPDNIRQHGAADTVLEVEQCIFIVAVFMSAMVVSSSCPK